MAKKVALIFGGRSLESEVSIITAIEALRAIDKSKYIVEPIYLFDGKFYFGNVDEIGKFVEFERFKHKRAYLESGTFYCRRFGVSKKLFTPDVALLCTHGGEGENGILQALLDFNGIPYTSCSVLPSAVCMDKEISKAVFASFGFDVMPSKTVFKTCFNDKTFFDIGELEMLEYPLIVKPANLGSSIGVSVANDREQLLNALYVAFEFCDKAIVEKKLVDCLEVNCAVFSHKGEIFVSATENPTNSGEFLSFDDKYIGGKMSVADHKIPAPIGPLEEKVKQITRDLYQKLALNGVVRIDYLCDIEREKIYVNEINTIPGSIAFYLFSKVEIAFDSLLSMLVEDALFRKENALSVRAYKSDILQNYSALQTVPQKLKNNKISG